MGKEKYWKEERGRNPFLIQVNSHPKKIIIYSRGERRRNPFLIQVNSHEHWLTDSRLLEIRKSQSLLNSGQFSSQEMPATAGQKSVAIPS